jgi:hypothetical protein
VEEWFTGNPTSRIAMTSVDADPNAIAYAQRLLSRNSDRVFFLNVNVLSYRAKTKFELIWSSGLFDYFTDHVFVRLLHRLLTFSAPGGELIIGNFSRQNPSRSFMELFGEWFLYHRSPAELIALAKAAGAKEENIRVGQEPECVNLFLHIRNA